MSLCKMVDQRSLYFIPALMKMGAAVCLSVIGLLGWRYRECAQTVYLEIPVKSRTPPTTHIAKPTQCLQREISLRARILSLDYTNPPTVRLILTKRIGNVIHCYICKMKARDVPMCIFRR